MTTPGSLRGLVRIREVNGRYEGRVEKGFPRPDEKERRPNAINATAPGATSRYWA